VYYIQTEIYSKAALWFVGWCVQVSSFPIADCSQVTVELLKYQLHKVLQNSITNNSAPWRVDTSTPSFVPETAVSIYCSLIAEWLSDGFIVIVILCVFLSGIIRQCQICQNACSLNVWCAYMDFVHVWSEHFITHTLPLWINWRLSQHLKVIHTTWPRGSAFLCGTRCVQIRPSCNRNIRYVNNCFQVLMPVPVCAIMTHY